MNDTDYPKYLFEYYHDGSWWSVMIPARSEEDAIERTKLIARAKLLGTVEAKIPASLPIAGLLARFICWWKNP